MCELVRPRSAPLSKVYPGAISSWFSLNRRLVRMTPDIREECDESLRHDRVHDDRVAQTGVEHARQHRGLDHGYDLAGLGAKHGEAESALTVCFDQSLHKAAGL